MNEIIKNKINEQIELLDEKESYLQLLRDLKDTKPNALLNKALKFNNEDYTISWNKPLQKDTLKVLGNAIRNELKNDDMLEGMKSDDYSNTLSMMKALKPLEIKILHKKNNKEIVFNILDTSQEKKTKITLEYKILFFYSYSYIHKVLKSHD